MPNTEYFTNVKPQNNFFKWIMIILAFICALPIVSSIIGLSGHFLQGAPSWFFIVSILISIISIYSCYNVYNLQKNAVYILFTSIIVHFLWYLFAYNIEFFDIIFAIFFFIGFGLLAIIPRWKYFK